MYLYCYRKLPNFGDDLNAYLWPRFIDAALSPEPGSEEVFVGIGTILNERLPKTGTLHIFGSGLGYGSVTKEMMENWRVHFVRGPLTAQALGLDIRLGISDPAILMHRTENLNHSKDIACAFMPHHGIHSERLRQLCEQANVFYIDPEADCETVIRQLLRSERLICSAMHGAIAAEALRIPWLPVATHPQMLFSKWEDWAAAMEMQIRFQTLPTIWPEADPSFKGRLVSRAKTAAFRRKLKTLASSSRFQLGPDWILKERLERIESKVQAFNYNQTGGR
ncbi:polysaccharide pyruvyl transferase family protein [Ectothiorhodospira variabilis]|uniref:polysaccharide pyruvyl transferase family protein n=1 Tax=Ectothiorhodospira variabilis TaxID=505694 RepID=UPI001EFB7388|nr:polysaccharide pyruvyl transferase family protein [Ectothiorhodospira variabilis]MCG5495336.1 polysaccharide pyruvyl transferase family protein [Ectothiorhodospira variabilis]MCG5504934.1 polysaccharide pyruvyl transferase family protein [Ectothiorhodospira variabilis]MCG5508091.1 polysaccharide pyruvyl transferase family protein [Ectothiorhodospira variabilis]